MLPGFNYYDDDLSVCYRNTDQFLALRGCRDSKNINIGFTSKAGRPQVCVSILIICNNCTMIRDGSQKLSE
jgi:hypothetical protein